MVYIYEADAEDLTGIGICGGLLPISCTYEEVGNGMSEVSMQHPIDRYGKYAELKVDRILSVETPVRTFPEIKDGAYVTSVETWTVLGSAAKKDRYIYTAKKDGRAVKLLTGGEKVTVVEIPTSSDTSRYKIKYQRWSGWIESKTLKYESTTDIGTSSAGIEKVESSWSVKPQLFRIYSVDLSDSGIVTVQAKHITYDLMYNITTYNCTGSYTLQDALDGVLDNCITSHDYTIKTNIGGSHVGAIYADYDPITALLDPDEGLCSKWGGELIRDNYDMMVLSDAGLDRGVYIEYAKNLAGVQMTTDLSQVCTRIRPLGETKTGEKLYLDTAQYSDGCVNSNKRGNYAFDRIMTLDVSEASEGDDTTIARARQLMVEAALAKFEKGADMPNVTINIEFAQLGSDPRYQQYKELDKIFLYDKVHVYHKALGIDTVSQVVHIEYDCINHRLISVELGDMKALTSTVSNYQLASGISGQKLVYGSVGSGQLADDSIAYRHIQSGSIYTDALQAGSVTADKVGAAAITSEKITTGAITADKLAVGAVTADKLAAGTIDAEAITAVTAKIESLTADDIATDRLAAAIASLGVLTAGDADIRKAIVKTLMASLMTVTDATAQNVYIENLQLSNAQMVQATIGTLICRASDGKYYRLDFDGTGNVVPVDVTSSISTDEITAGVTDDGKRTIIETSLTVDDLGADTVRAVSILANKITTAELDVGTITSNSAIMNGLYTSAIYGGKSLEVIIDALTQADKANSDANAELAPTVNSIKKWFRFSDAGLVVGEDGAGSIWQTATDNVGFHIRRTDMADGVYVGSFERDRLVIDNIQIGRVLAHKSSSGGWVFNAINE